MKKTKKWFIVPMITIPIVIIIIVSLLIAGISVKNLPLWAVIGIPLLILMTPFTFLFIQGKVYDTPLQKKKKRLLILFCAYIVFSVLLLITFYYVNSQMVWIIALQLIIPLPFIFHANFRLFFPKKENCTKDISQNDSNT